MILLSVVACSLSITCRVADTDYAAIVSVFGVVCNDNIRQYASDHALVDTRLRSAIRGGDTRSGDERFLFWVHRPTAIMVNDEKGVESGSSPLPGYLLILETCCSIQALFFLSDFTSQSFDTCVVN